MVLEMCRQIIYFRNQHCCQGLDEKVDGYTTEQSCHLPPGAVWISLMQKLHTSQGTTKKKEIAINNSLIVRVTYILCLLCARYVLTHLILLTTLGGCPAVLPVL